MTMENRVGIIDNIQKCSNWETVETPIFSTIQIVIDYEITKKSYEVMDYSKSCIEYRSRKRNLFNGLKDTIYATEDSYAYLKSLGYEKVY